MDRASQTDYTYSTTSGKLTQRDFPTVSSNNIRTSYAYDSAGRLKYETVTREAGGTTNLTRTDYAYSYLAYGNQVVRKEAVWMETPPFPGSWLDLNRVTYQYDAMRRQDYEEREDNSMDWSGVYDFSQEYDKNGNRTRYHKNVAIVTFPQS